MMEKEIFVNNEAESVAGAGLDEPIVTSVQDESDVNVMNGEDDNSVELMRVEDRLQS